MDLGLDGKGAVVLGSTSGLGRAIAESLSAEGARVLVCGRRGDVARSIAGSLAGAVGVEIDLDRDDAVAAVTEAAAKHLGRVDVLVLNSGGPAPGPAAGLDPASLEAPIRSMLLRQVELVNAFLPGMRESGWGRILAVGSSGVAQPIPNLVRSNMIRAALAAYLKTLAAEVAADGVTVNIILPGRIATDRTEALDQGNAERQGVDIAAVRERSRGSIPAGRYGTVQEFAAMAAFLCGAPASYITGSAVRVDGGSIGTM